MTAAAPLHGQRVVEIGDRIAVAACGSVLMSLGAHVTVADHGRRATAGKWIDHVVACSGKTIVQLEPGAAALENLLSEADVVLHSSDLTEVPRWNRPPSQIVCDITAYGKTGPMAGVAHADPLVQALSGLADTTGEASAPPMIAGFPVTEGIAALYAAAGVVAALRVRTASGRGQDVEVALYDCAFSTLTTFLPFHFVGETITRGGNKHVLASPWNIYEAADGWLILCTGTDEQWRRLCNVMERPDLASDAALAKVDGRVADRERVDALVQAWVAGRSAAQCVAQLEAQGIAAGPIVMASELAREQNIAHRKLAAKVSDAQAGAFAHVLPTAIRFAPREPRHSVAAAQGAASSSPAGNLEVFEIGQYTTAPLVARQLGALGAEVIKVESPDGDGTRGWAPRHDGQGYFFALSNSDKVSVCLDLRKDADRTLFVSRLAHADVLVENLKPGSLERLGLGADMLSRINPRLVYCAISGFGADSAYPGRPAFDTVVQAMSGVMDLNRANGVPQKTGISLADILGGAFGLVATLAALFERDVSGSGACIDISMQDASAWATQWAWRGRYANDAFRTIRCADGYVVAGPFEEGATDAKVAALSRADLVRSLEEKGIAAAPVLDTSEVVEHPQTIARQLLLRTRDSSGREWPAFESPIRLSLTPARVRKAIGRLGEANAGFTASRSRRSRSGPAR